MKGTGLGIIVWLAKTRPNSLPIMADPILLPWCSRISQVLPWCSL